jgi:hypothetical protein
MHFFCKNCTCQKYAFVDCNRGKAVGGWPAVAVGYDLEGTIRFRTCPRFPARGDWFSDALNLCPGVSESARPSGDFDDRNKTTSQMEVDCRRAHGDTILSGLVLVSRQKPKGPPSYRLAIGESLIGLPSLAAASESDKGLKNARVNQPHQIPTSDPGNQHFLGAN